MKALHNRVIRKAAALLLAMLFICSGLAVLAEESPAAPPSGVGQEVDAESGTQPEPSASPSPEPEVSEPEPGAEAPSTPPESELEPEQPETSSLEENEAGAYAALPALVTGGHTPYMSGYENGTFRPNNSITRAEVAQVLYNLLAAKPPVTTSPFPDVKFDSWYGKAVSALEKSGILKGYENGTFRPGNSITRAEFVAALWACFPAKTGTVSFTDVDEDFWAYPYIASACSYGWIHGYEDNTFRPKNAITRAEVVTILNAALERTGSGFAEHTTGDTFPDLKETHWAYKHIVEATGAVAGVETPSPSPSPGPTGEYVSVTADDGLNMREGPSISTKVITTLKKGTVLTVLDKTSSLPWIKVRTDGGTEGYVHQDYVVNYVPGSENVSISTSSATLHQYQSLYLVGSVTPSTTSMKWYSTNDAIATVQNGYVYGVSPGTATIVFANADESKKATCTVTVTAPEAVRFAYSEANVVTLNSPFNLLAVTDPSKTGVKFTIVDGPATGAYETTTSSTDSSPAGTGKLSGYSPANSVKVFKKAVTFAKAGTYTVRATSTSGSGYSSSYYEFTVFVSSAISFSQTTFEERRTSTSMLNIIKEFEGYCPLIYPDPYVDNAPTIGYGYVVNSANSLFYNNMTKTEATALLMEAVNQQSYAKQVNYFRSKYNLKMNQNQFDALVSFNYNLGSGYMINAENYGIFNVILNSVTPPAASAGNPYSAKLLVQDTNLYKQPNDSSGIVKTLTKGDSVSVIGVNASKKTDVWYQISSGGSTGWARSGNFRFTNSSSMTHDLAYVNAIDFAYNMLQWNTSGGQISEGLVWRRLAESKVFCYGNYAEAVNGSANYTKNTYGFDFPQGTEKYDRR